MRIGYVGLGTMGLPMVINLLNKGFEVTVYDTVQDRITLVIAAGGVSASSPKAVASESDLTMLSLPKAEISETVALGKDGILEGASKGTTIVELSTVPPSTVRRIGHEALSRGVDTLDAPVSGGRSRAEEATLTIMAGGKKEVFERCLPVFKAIASHVYYAGELGSGETIKLMNSLIAISNLMAAREALRISRSEGVDSKLLHEVVSNSTGESWMWSNWVRSIIQDKTVGSTAEIMLKDMTYALQMATELAVDTPIAESALKTIEDWRRKSPGPVDASLMFEFLKSR